MQYILYDMTASISFMKITHNDYYGHIFFKLYSSNKK